MAKKIIKKTSRTTHTSARKKAPKGFGAWFTSAPREPSTLNDTKNAILLVSLTINLAVFIGWLLLKLTTVYDEQVVDFLFSR
jgi:hypothetical protein